MRILIVSNLFPPEFIGGYELIAWEFATRFAAAGHVVAVATSPLINHAQELTGIRFSVHRSLGFDGLDLDNADLQWRAFRGGVIHIANIAALRGLIEEFRPDRVVLSNIAGLGPLGIVAFLYQSGFSPAIYLGDNVFQSAGADPRSRDAFMRLFRARPALSGLRVIAVSQSVVEETETALATRFRAPLFVPGWVADDLPKFLPPEASRLTRFVFSSRVAPHKGIWILFDAVQKMVATGDDAFVVDVYGNGQVPELMQRVHAAGLDQHIRYAGVVGREEMIARFATYDALLFPTWQREPLGLVPFEAAAQGCIPILTAQAGASEWLRADDCIKVMRTPDGLAGGMQRVMFMSPSARAAMCQVVSERTRRLFSAHRWFPRIEAAIAELPDPTSGINPRMVQDAFFAITRMWRG